jgi:hypothetical protein
MQLKNFSVGKTCSLIILILSLGIVFGSNAHAQSGRKIPKPTNKPLEPVQPKATPPEESKPAKPQNKEPQIKIMVVFQQQSIYNPRIYSDFVAAGCLDRLQKSLSASGQFGREMNRKEASDFAKASSEVYVVWFELESDAFASGSTGSRRDDFQSMYVNFTLFAPVTGKSQTSGHIYQNQGGVLSRPVPQNAMTAEYILRKAGSDLADRILKTLNLPLPPNYD